MDHPGSNANILMAEYRLKERSVNFSKEEINRLQILLNKYKNILICKKTDGNSSKQKDHAWHSIEKEFNANGQTPRTIKQLKYKFENMKRCAKKEACKERQEMRRTGGGKPPSLPPDSEDATDWLRAIMSTSIDGNVAVCNDDVITPNITSTPKMDKINIKVIDLKTTEEIQPLRKVSEIVPVEPVVVPTDEDTAEGMTEQSKWEFDASTPHSSLKRPISSPLKRLTKRKKVESNLIRTALREKKMTVIDELHILELQKVKDVIALQKELHMLNLKHSEERHKLEMLNIELEIDILRFKRNDLKNNH